MTVEELLEELQVRYDDGLGDIPVVMNVSGDPYEAEINSVKFEENKIILED